MDDADIAQIRMEAEEARRDAALAKLKPVKREPRDDCLNCECSLPEERKISWFCGKECADEWDYITKRQEANR